MNIFEVTPKQPELVEKNVGRVGDPKPQRIDLKNISDRVLDTITVTPTGEGAKYVKLAPHKGDGPGTYADRGQSIIAHQGQFSAQGTCHFWAMPVFEKDDREGRYPLEFQIKTEAVG